ncbi:MAG: hypothetical protein ACD_19C00429G0009 [uncultured bacterium]|nr:MAG: hypothetical protein ACD_19C00429G0009 [uncultured bacterium]
MFWNLFPWISNKTAQAVYPNIYLPKFVYENLQSKNPNISHVALLIHESEHIKRQKRMGILKWGIQYFFIPRFRYEEEIAADVPKLRYLKQNGGDPNTEKRSKQLSGWLYLWPVVYSEAKSRLEHIWNNL